MKGLQHYIKHITRLAQITWKLGSRNTLTRSMERNVNVRLLEEEERLRISFEHSRAWFFSAEEIKKLDDRQRQSLRDVKPRLYTLNRPKSEELEKTLCRISANVTKQALKGVNKKKKAPKKAVQNGEALVNETETKQEESAEIPVSLLYGLSELDEGLRNSEAWKHGGVLKVGEVSYNVVVNPPAIISMKLPACIMSGFTIFPNIEAEFLDYSLSKFKWYRASPCQVDAKETTDTEWELVCAERFYIPSNADIGRKLKLTCVPINDRLAGESCEVISSEVSAGPGICPFENRQKYTADWAEESFRVMTYNLLADFYADSDFSRNNLFPYCPRYALNMDYRRNLLMKEIPGYKADIICLQEVDRKLFLHGLSPLMREAGYEGFLKTKMNETPEGTATFFRTKKFRFISRHDIDLATELESKEMYRDIFDKLSTNEALKEKVMKRSTILQVTVLETLEDPKRKVIVATTHLFFHPRAPHVRLIQTTVCLRHLEEVVQQYTDEERDSPSVIFCGDFNSAPCHGVHELLLENKISPKHGDFYAGGVDELVEDFNLTHNLRLANAAGIPSYTNYVAGFIGVLDYIFIDKSRLKTKAVIPMPTHEEVTQFTAIPNPVFPSDHIAIVCDVAWNEQDTS